MQHFIKKTLVVAINLILPTTLAYAQDAFVLEEIVVTAQKRSQNLQDVPISISTMTGDKMAEAGLQRFEDFTAYVPNFSVSKDAIGDKINIRGIQSGTQAGLEQSVGTFVDGIYRGRAIQSRYAFLDVERVEILRGPQGTLFGKNTIAGALNITTAKPTTELDGEVSVSHNVDFDETEVQGFIAGPLTDQLSGRFSLLHRKMDEGWVENLAPDKQDVPENDEVAGRIALEWDASDTTAVAFKYEYAEFEVTGMPWDLLDGGPQQPFAAILGDSKDDNYKNAMGNQPTNFGPGLDFSATDPNGVLDFGTNNLLDGDSEETSITIESELKNGATLTAIAGYSAYQFKRYLDSDFGPLNAIRFDDEEDFEQSSFELRLASATGGRFEYITGLFAQKQNLTADALTYFHTDTLNPVLAGGCGLASGNVMAVASALGGAGTGIPPLDAQTAAGAAIGNGESNAAVVNNCALFGASLNAVANGIPGLNRYASMDQDTETWALFAQGTWNLRDDLRATLGIRYTEEDKEAKQTVFATDFTEGASIATSNPISIALAHMVGEFTTHSFDENDPGMSRDEESLTWSANIQWDISPEVMMYASASTGFKGGGYNTFYMGASFGAGADSREVSFDEEDVVSFELGTKMTLLDGAAVLNMAYFYTEFDDLQASIFSGNTSFTVQNVAKAVSQGIEIDGRWRATKKLTLSGSLGWIDFEYDEFPNQVCTNDQFVAARQGAFDAAAAVGSFPGMIGSALAFNNATCSAAGINNLEGKTSENTPELQVSMVANYLQPIGDYQLNLSLDLNWSDETYRAGDLDFRTLSDDVLKVNLAATLGPREGHWDVSLVIKNLTDETSFNWMDDTPLFSGSYMYAMEAPRSFTLKGRYHF